MRALRHYDEVGLLRPASVDESSGYRFYSASQLPALNRILALKDLGFTLAEITRLTEAGVSADELAGMMRLRQAEAERSAAAERRRLERVAARIDLLRSDPDLSSTAIVIKHLDPMHLATASEAVDDFDADFATVFERLYGQVFGGLELAGVAPSGPHCALYEARDDGRIDAIAAVPIPATADPSTLGMLVVREIPPAARAATLVHVGDMAFCDRSYQILQRWIEDANETAVGYSREIYLDCEGPKQQWVTELQFVLETGDPDERLDIP